MSESFDATALQRRYAFLDDCPEDLLDQLVALPAGTLQERVEGALRWRRALLTGRMPPDAGWPPEEISTPIRRALGEMNIVRFCEGQPELVNRLLRDIVAAFGRQADTVRSEVAARLRELELLERVRQTEDERARARQDKRPTRKVRIDEVTRRRLRTAAERDVMDRDRGRDEELIVAWGERARAWAEIADVFGDLGEMMGRGWDMSLGVLRHTGWLDLLRLRELVERLPQLREIVRALGRLHVSDHGPSVAERILVAVRRVEEEVREVRTPHVPSETRGVERSGEIARMLPAEASMLGHPKLRLLWHARRAERALLTYRVEGVEGERIATEREGQAEAAGRRPRPERGPIVAVIDTSGSMHGLPEQVAKALVLEALRTAHTEKRRCLLYAYSGPGQVREHELSLTPDGIGRLLEFLGFSFGGGNDETGVLSRVLVRLKQEGWSKADVIFVSDGEWPAPTSIIAAVESARENETRFHGVQIGNRGRTGLHALCEPVHVFQDWAALNGWGR